MIAEKFPLLSELEPEDKLLLASELYRSATEARSDIPELSEKAVAVLEARIDHYLENPETGISWEDLKRKALSRR